MIRTNVDEVLRLKIIWDLSKFTISHDFVQMSDNISFFFQQFSEFALKKSKASSVKNR